MPIRLDPVTTDNVKVLSPLQKAQKNLEIWEAALQAIATGQTYRVGTRQLERADLSECQKMVQYYENEVSRLSKGRGRGARVIRITPRDL